MQSPVHPNLAITRLEIMVMLMNLFMRHNFTNAALVDLLKMLNLIIGFKTLPETYRKFHDFFSANQYEKHFVCEDCGLYIGVEHMACTNCKSRRNFYFIMFDFKSNLRDILKKNWLKIQQYVQEAQQKTVITDIVNAAVSKRELSLNSVSLNFNTDGVKVFNSNNKRSLWPIIAVINELPPHLRFLRKNALIGGLWMHCSEPDMDVFLKPFLLTLKTMFLEGLHIGTTFISSVRTVACCVDTLARSKLQNFKQFNGYNACSYCLHPGHHASGSQVKYGFLEGVKLRNYTDTLKAMAVSSSRGIPISGVKGVSPLILIPSFDVVKQCPVDFMHGVLLGVVKQLCKIWFEKPNTPYYIKTKIKLIDEALITISPFTEASRSARKISERCSWKANEWLQWFLHYSSVCLKHLLPIKYYEHYRILVTSITELLQNNINNETLDSCELKLHKFVKDFEVLYSLDEMNYNVHLLMHIVECCRDFGPLWAFSLFFYEDINGMLKKFVKGPNEPLIQIANRCTMAHTRFHLEKYWNIQSKVRDFCENTFTGKTIIPSKNLKFTIPNSIVNKYNDKLVFEEISFLNHNGFLFKPKVKQFKNIEKPNNDSFFAFDSDNQYHLGEIHKILADECDYYFLFKGIDAVSIEEDIFEKSCSNDIMYMIKLDEPIHKYIQIHCNNEIYFCKLKYSLQTD